ncbi:MAG: tripartite tricarboxylate transporter substrate binding protein [Lautropia sp.]
MNHAPNRLVPRSPAARTAARSPARRSAVALALGIAIAAGATPAMAAWPERPITVIVPWGAGGGTDAVARFIAAELEKDLKQPVNVVNRTGGSGVVGHSAIATAAPDGYTLGMITVEIAMMKHAGLTKLGPSDYTALALMNFDPNAVFVKTESPIKDVKGLIEAAKANPGKLKASGTGQGGIWHLGLAGMLVDAKAPGTAIGWVPSQGAAPGLQDLVAGGVDAASCSLPEARALVEAGKVRPLVLMADKPDGLFPKVPLLKAETGSSWTNGAWRGIAGPKGLPADISSKLEATLKKINESAGYQDFLKQRGFGSLYADGKGFAAFMAKEDQAKGAVMKAVGIAK